MLGKEEKDRGEGVNDTCISSVINLSPSCSHLLLVAEPSYLQSYFRSKLKFRMKTACE